MGAVYVEFWARGLGYTNPPGSGFNLTYGAILTEATDGTYEDLTNTKFDDGRISSDTIAPIYHRGFDISTWANSTRTVTLSITGGGCICQIKGPYTLRVVRSY